MSAAAEIARSLSAIADRGAGTNAERRAAAWLATEVERGGGRGTALETFWCRPNWAMAQAWHAGLGLAGSLVSIATPDVGAGLLAAALLCTLADASFGTSPGRRLTPEHASQNVVSPAPPRAGSATPPLRLIVTANLDAGRQGLAYREGLRRASAKLRAATGGRAPGWAAWLAIALAWALTVALLRATGSGGTALKLAQLLPTVGLVLALAVLLELAGAAWCPGAGDNAAGVGVAIALVRALDAAPPAHAAVELVLTGAGDGQIVGLRRYLRRHREHRPRTTVVLGLGPCGAGIPAWLRSDGALIPRGYSPVLRRLAAEVAGQDPGLGLRALRSRGSSPALAARYAGLPALTITARDPLGLAPRSHRATDTGERLDDDAIERVLLACLALVDAIDAYLADVTPA